MIDAGDIRAPAAPGADSAPNLRLSEARQAQNLTTADVARRLKLSVWQIEALESGQYHQLPGPMFVRGFIRNYARLLGLDPEELANAVSSLLPQPAPPPDNPPSRDIPFPRGGRRRWPRFAVPAAALVALLAVYEFYFSDATDTVATPSGRLAALPSPQEPRPSAPAKKPRETQASQPAAAAAPSPQA
ncbi:MAG: helix-turn-helix domain-containing protein, partial [Burkholderiales bacterium]